MRRAWVYAAATVVALAALVPIGLWERSHRAHTQVDGMRRVLTAIGPLDGQSLDAYRYLAGFQCLLYKRGKNPFALEICVDSNGRVVEAIDRRGSSPRIWSLRDDPTRSTVRVDRDEVDRLLIQLGVPPHYVEVVHPRSTP